jgi:outer membrane protein OmpA-like peptidoglycan-associated protein/tetratricopeptide (TPR) repeat protein
MKQITFFILALLFSTVIFAQDYKDIKTLYKEAESHVLYEEYQLALPLYLEIVNKGLDNANIQFNIGNCYLNVNRQIKQAIPYLEKAVTYITTNYKEGNYKEERAPEEAWFYLAKAYRIDGQFDKSIDAYIQFKATLNVSDVYMHDFIQLQVKTCETAKKMLSNPVYFLSEELNFNEEGDNYYPAVAGDEKSIIFTAYQEDKDPDFGSVFFENLYYSTKEGDQWKKPRDLTSEIVSDGYFSSASLNYAGNFLILYRDDYGNGNLYYSELDGKKWTPVVKFPKQISGRDKETHASISKDGTLLYFVSDRMGGYGETDIWVSVKDDKGRWGTPTNLGPIINTEFREEAAFITEDGNTLYFASESHNSMGGYDIFKSTKVNNSEWSQPQNLGYPINSAADDVFYVPIGNGNVAYYAKYPVTGGNQRIYRIEFPEIERVVEVVAEEVIPADDTIYPVEETSSENTNEAVTEVVTPMVPETVTIVVPSEYELRGTLKLQDNNELNATFYVHVAKSDGEVIAALSPDVTTGEFRTKIKFGSYTVKAFGEGYEPAEKFIYISETQQNDEVLTFLEMIPKEVSSGEYFTIKSVFFDYNSAELNRDGQIEVEKLSTLMAKNPSLYIEVVGNTDAHGTEEYNQQLSIKRARSVVSYLQNKGIEPARFVTKGLGKSNFIAINQNPDGSDNVEGRRLNRRVDMKVIKSNDDKITTENIYVPDELKYKEFLTYTIFLMEKSEPLKPSYFSASGEDVANVWMFRTEAGYMYTIGKFNHQSEALTLMNKVVDAGFPDARVISSIEYNQLIQKSSNFYKSKMEETDKQVYTIQLYALKKPVEVSAIKGLEDVEVIQNSDGYYRYVWGEFIGKTSARQALANVMQKGFYDAFIVDTQKLKN